MHASSRSRSRQDPNNSDSETGTPPVLLTEARVIVGDGRTVLDNAAIVIRDGLIENISTVAAADPNDHHVVSLQGKTVMPTIVNPHGHIGYMKGAVAHRDNYSRDNIVDHLRRLVYYGVSVFQSLGTDRNDTEIEVRDAQRAGRLGEHDVAMLLTAGAGIVSPTTGATNCGPFFATDVMYEATNPAETRRYVQRLAAQRVDIVKFWLDDRHGTKQKLSQPLYEAVIDEAHTHGLKVAAHIYTLDDAKKAVRAGADVLAHLPRDERPDGELIDLLISNNVAVFTSLSIQRPDGEKWLDDPSVAETTSAKAISAMRAEIRRHAPEPLFDTTTVYERMEKTLLDCHDAGVRLVFSGDSGLFTQFLGLAEHRELDAITAAGVPPLAAIQYATQRSAELLGLSDRGTLEPGKRADLLVLDADPCDDINNTKRIAAVYLAGKTVDRERLRQRFDR